MNGKIKLLDDDIRLRMAIVTGLFATLFVIYLAGDIWVWRGAMLGELGIWVKEEGGEVAFWGAAIIYGLIILLAFAMVIFDGRWFRWMSFGLLMLLLLSSMNKTLGGFGEYAEVGWYFLILFSVQLVINLALVFLSFHWARLTGK